MAKESLKIVLDESKGIENDLKAIQNELGKDFQVYIHGQNVVVDVYNSANAAVEIAGRLGDLSAVVHEYSDAERAAADRKLKRRAKLPGSEDGLVFNIDDLVSSHLLANADKDGIIAAGPIIKHENMQAYRVVIRVRTNDLVVADQTFPKYVNGTTQGELKEYSFGNGSYFPPYEFENVLKIFHERNLLSVHTLVWVLSHPKT